MIIILYYNSYYYIINNELLHQLYIKYTFDDTFDVSRTNICRRVQTKKKKDQVKFLCIKTRKDFSLLIDGQKMHTIRILENV